jgi:uncharacterized protein YdcH (DUF465 family)
MDVLVEIVSKINVLVIDAACEETAKQAAEDHLKKANVRVADEIYSTEIEEEILDTENAKVIYCYQTEAGNG